MKIKDLIRLLSLLKTTSKNQHENIALIIERVKSGERANIDLFPLGDEIKFIYNSHI